MIQISDIGPAPPAPAQNVLIDLSPSDFAAQWGQFTLSKPFYHTCSGHNSQTQVCGQLGTYGNSAYAPTKFALRGFAECMSMELDAAGKEANRVNISVCYPPDTKTPGYEVENEKKSEACHLITEGAGIWDLQDVGKRVVKEAISTNPPFDIYFGLEGWMLSTITGGINPVTRAVYAICQVALMGLLRFVSLFYLMESGRIAQQCINRKNGNDNFKTE